MRRSFISAAIALAGVAAIGVPAVAAHASSDPDVLYKSTVSPLPDNLPSVGYQATQTSEFGNQVVFTKAAQPLGSVIVTMSSWGCQTGGWTTKNCVTKPGATFTEPITLNIYSANAPGNPLPGRLITSLTKTFKIPYRPSSSPNCTTNGGWGSGCANGKAANITFNFSKSHVSLPSSIVFGIAYNTSQYGATPNGCDLVPNANCPADSLNVAVSQDPTNVTKGSDPNPGKVFWNTSTPANYCDAGGSGTPGSGIFRLDSPGSSPSDQCWSTGTPGTPPYYVPAVEFLEA